MRASVAMAGGFLHDLEVRAVAAAYLRTTRSIASGSIGRRGWCSSRNSRNLVTLTAPTRKGRTAPPHRPRHTPSPPSGRAHGPQAPPSSKQSAWWTAWSLLASPSRSPIGRSDGCSGSRGWRHSTRRCGAPSTHHFWHAGDVNRASGGARGPCGGADRDRAARRHLGALGACRRARRPTDAKTPPSRNRRGLAIRPNQPASVNPNVPLSPPHCSPPLPAFRQKTGGKLDQVLIVLEDIPPSHLVLDICLDPQSF